ncbi:MAG: hypothetical protein BA870_00680 [Desulfuromonadales bacterium C00003094]|jgi:uncharacterized Tic20 family protein|nr:MAG: hypothetical protein BA870_00680 [Desulfuromonadales bacterium C00003094]
MTERSHAESNWATFCHLSALAGYLLPFSYPFSCVLLGNLIGPLIIWLLKKDLSPSVDQHGKEALNFQISISIYALAASALIVILIGIPLLIGLAVFNFILIIVAAVKCKNGKAFRYPLSLRLLK